MKIFLALTVACAIAYLFFYFNNHAYLKEYFYSGSAQTNGGSPDVTKIDTAHDYNYTPRRTQIDNDGDSFNNDSEQIVYPSRGEVQMTTVETPYSKQPIQDVDDYEYNMVFTNESNTALSKGLRQKLMSQYPMHWTTYPPSSSQFQAGLQESFQNATQNVPDDAQPYQNISGSMMSPPDLSAVEKEERKILQTYQPTFPPIGTTYDSRDANVLIKKMYDAKGLIAEVNHKTGTNVYEIVGTRRKNEKVVYEDEQAPTKGTVAAAGEGTINVPASVNDLTTSNRDVFYNKGVGETPSNPWQYTSWTPGLERTFAPTDPKQSWT